MIRKPWLFLLGIALASVTGCVAAPKPVYDVHHAALVSPPSPPMWSGKTRDSGFALGNSSVIWADAPHQDADATAGLYVASTQFDGTVHIDLGPSGRLALWVPMSYGLSEYAFSAKECLIDKPSRGNFTGGLGVAFWGELTGPWYLGASLETQLSFVTARVRADCVTNCEYAHTLHMQKQELEVIPVIRAALVTGFDFDWIRFFFGMSIRNHPWNEESTTYEGFHPGEIDDTVTFGYAYFLFGTGAEVDLGDHVSLLAQVYKPLALKSDTGRERMDYGPILGVTLDLHFPRRR